jgi:hypothetical protein
MYSRHEPRTLFGRNVSEIWQVDAPKDRDWVVGSLFWAEWGWGDRLFSVDAIVVRTGGELTRGEHRYRLEDVELWLLDEEAEPEWYSAGQNEWEYIYGPGDHSELGREFLRQHERELIKVAVPYGDYAWK